MILTKEKIKGIDLDNLLFDRIDAGRISNTLIIVPTNRKARHFKKQIISSCKNGTSSKINIETLTTISQKILEPSLNFHIMSEAAASIMLKQSINDTALQYFSIYKNRVPFGTLDRIKNIISKFKENGISSDEILSEAKQNLKGSNQKKAIDLANIYKCYKSKCRKMKYFEIGDVYEEILILGDDKISENYKKRFTNTDLVIILGFDEFTIPEVKIINSLANIDNLQLFLDFDYYEYNPLIFKHLDKCSYAFSTCGFKIIEDLSISEQTDFKQIIKSSLFKSNIKQKNNKYLSQIVKIKGTNRIKEVEYIAKEIKTLITEKKVDPNKICVSFNLIKNYSPIIRDVFTKYKIPFNLTDRYSLDNSTLITFIINLLNIEENDYYFKDVFRILNNKYIKNYIGDSYDLVNAAGELKITIGKRNWIDSINNKINVKDQFLDNDENNEINIERYKNGLFQIEKIIALLKPFSANLTIDQFFNELKKLITILKIPSTIITNNITTDQKNIKALTTFIETLKEVFNLLKKEYGNETEFNLNFYLENIKTSCKWARYNIKEISDYGVLITTINEFRGLNFDYLFVGGLIDGDFPTRYNPEIFNQETFMQKDVTHQTEERYHFYQTLCSWNKQLFLSAPELQGESELEESIFFKELEKIFFITERNLSQEKQTNYDSMVYSDEEFFILFGKALNENNTELIKKLVENPKFAKFKENIAKIINYLEIDNIRRNDNTNQTMFNGYILPSELNDENTKLIQQLLNYSINKQFSITQLEEYAKCPFKYFTGRLLKIKTTKEPTEELETFEIGNLLHDILFDFYNELRDKNISISNCTDEIFKKAKQMLFNIAEKKVAESNLIFPISFFEREKILGINGKKDESVLTKYLENEQKETNNFLPEFFEVKFGYIKGEKHDKILSIDESLDFGGVKIRGKIDRIDIDKETKTFNIIDYKSGKTKPSSSDMWDGISLQLPVYMMAAKQLIVEYFKEEYNPLMMYLYRLRYSEKDLKRDLLKITNKTDYKDIILENNELFDETLKNIKNHIQSINKGIFNLSRLENRENKICSYCEFQYVCRVSEVNN
ncbi:MAG: PD-(D/E)XK nuclease family protein [bacterium]